MAQSLKSKTAHGLKWSTLSTIIHSSLQIGYSALIARLLGPADFGLVAMAGVFLRFGSYFTNMGMAQAIIQKKELSDEDVRSAFTSSQILGILFTALFWFIAPLATHIFDNPDVVPIIRTMSFSFLLSALSTTSQAIIKRRMDFRSLAIIEVTSYFVGYVMVGLTMALSGYGVWSLVFATLSQSAISTTLNFIFARHSLRFFFSWQHYKPLLKFGGQVSLISFVQFICANLDTLLIGKLLGASSLGIYNRAFMLVSLPMNYISHSFSKVLFPAFSRLQDDLNKIRELYTSAMSLSLTVLLPVSFGMIAASEEIVLVLLGEKWMTAVPIFRILLVTISFSYVTHISGIIIQATNRAKEMFILEGCYLIVFSLLIFFFADYGLTGVGWAVMIGWFFRCTCYVFLMKHILQFDYKHIFKAYLVNFAMSSAVFLSIYFVKSSMNGYSVWVLLPTEIFVGAAVYFTILWFFISKIFGHEVLFWLNKVNQAKTNPILKRISLMVS